MNMVVQKQIDHVPHHLFTQRPCSNPTLMPHFKSELQSLRVTVVLHLCSFTLNSLVRNSYCISCSRQAATPNPIRSECHDMLKRVLVPTALRNDIAK